MQRWVAAMPAEWGYNETTMIGPIRGAALPMGFNRQPHYDRGLLLVGDAGGMVNPFNGEGIAYAMESGRLAADVIAQAFARGRRPARAGAAVLPAGHEGRARRLLHPRPGLREDDRQPRGDAARHEVRPAAHHLMRFLLKLMANLAEPHGGDAGDRIIHGPVQDGPGRMTQVTFPRMTRLAAPSLDGLRAVRRETSTPTQHPRTIGNRKGGASR